MSEEGIESHSNDDGKPEFITMVSDGEEEEEDGNDIIPMEEYPRNVLNVRIAAFQKLTVNATVNKQGYVCSRIHQCDDVRWRLRIYPYGYNPNGPGTYDYISTFCEICEDDEVVSGKRTKFCYFIVEIQNSRDPTDTIPHSTFHTFSNAHQTAGWRVFTTRERILDPESPFIQPDGSITFIVHFIRLPDWISRVAECRRKTGHIGISSQDAGYEGINSLIQMLYHIPAFTRAVFRIPTEHGDSKRTSVPLALQRTFFNMKYSPVAVSIGNLLQCLEQSEANPDHLTSMHDLFLMLLGFLRQRMHGTGDESVATNLFSGTLKHTITASKVAFEVVREEPFYDIVIDIQTSLDLVHSLDKLVEGDYLDGDEMYDTKDFGKQPVRIKHQFLSLPPVLLIQLQRWTGDGRTATKINDKYEFPMILDLSHHMSEEAAHDKSYVYELYAIFMHTETRLNGFGEQHYLFMRPSVKGKWFRFNKERVIPETEKTVMTEAFGGTEWTPYVLPHTSAYALVYIQKNEIKKVFSHLHSSDIPHHFHRRYGRSIELVINGITKAKFDEIEVKQKNSHRLLMDAIKGRKWIDEWGLLIISRLCLNLLLFFCFLIKLDEAMKKQVLKKEEHFLRVMPDLLIQQELRWSQSGVGPEFISLCELLKGNAIPTKKLNLSGVTL